MRIRIFSIIVSIILLYPFSHSQAQKSKADDPKMDWWKEAKFGMFIHWGLYAVPAGNWGDKKLKAGEYAEWIQSSLKIPVADYKPLASKFNPVKFNAEEWVLLAKEAGMKYMVLTAKHHEGFAMFKSSDPFNIVDATPYGKDVVKALAEACKKHGMHFGLYYSQAQDWNHPGGSAMTGHWDKAQEGSFDEYLDQVAVPQVNEILSAYNPEILWWDTPTDMNKERAAKFAPVLAKYPRLITNDRLGGDVEGDLNTPEQYIPATGIPGKNWESCMTMNGTWGYSTNDHNWKSTETLVRNLVDIASKGGNYLLNVGPDALGVIPEPSVERLKEVGKWMKVNGEAIYGVSASPFDDILWGRTTQKKNGKNTRLYLHIFDWPEKELSIHGLQNKVVKAYPLAEPKKTIKTRRSDSDILINLNGVKQSDFATVIVLEIEGRPLVIKSPEIKAGADSFIDEVSFEISSSVPDAVVRYTIDGSDPVKTSSKAAGPVVLKKETDFVVNARVFVNDKAVSVISEKKFTRVKPMPAFYSAKPGLRYSYYEGGWERLPGFSKLTPVKTGTVDHIGLEMRARNQDYGLVFEGCLNIAETNVYTFFLTSDDGSQLFINDKMVIDNDYLHGMVEKKVELPLAAGIHKIAVHFFQQGGGDGLKLEWQPLGKARSEIDKSLWCH